MQLTFNILDIEEYIRREIKKGARTKTRLTIFEPKNRSWSGDNRCVQVQLTFNITDERERMKWRKKQKMKE